MTSTGACGAAALLLVGLAGEQPDAHVEATLRRAGSVGNGAERKVADAILRRFGLVDDAEDEDDAEAARSVQSASEAF